MNIYKSLNNITKYIDDNLDKEISYETMAKIIGVNIFTLQKIFSLLTNVSLADYIRKRKLSVAGADIYTNKLKVMEAAIKYGYESATSFSRAFELFHKVKPSLVTKQSTLVEFPRIVFDENQKITSTMAYEIVELSELNLFGKYITTTNLTIENDAPNFFQDFRKKYEEEYGEPQYGMITYSNPCREECEQYYVLYDKEITGFEKVDITSGKWLRFRINSQEATDIRDMSQKFYIDFLPSCKYNLRDIYELEYYHDGVTDFLVPIC
ncbi:MAG: helix-turn-helix domain-containing protein [Mycoplasmatota bacterium]|nr:helix-turn-helix domain-containing protein [Mycoplasmatota bacterium]